jgi:hypothetical protein
MGQTSRLARDILPLIAAGMTPVGRGEWQSVLEAAIHIRTRRHCGRLAARGAGAAVRDAGYRDSGGFGRRTIA